MSAHKLIKPLGRVEEKVLRFFMKTAVVREAEVIDERFRLITLAGDDLRGHTWTPGTKVAVQFGSFQWRTYTPLSWDSLTGTTQLLLYVHGEAPGAEWARSVRVGDSCLSTAPRDSIDLNTVERPALVFGDETSFALAYTLRACPQRATGASMVFEVDSKRVAENVLRRMGIDSDAQLVERAPNDAHLVELERLITRQIDTSSIRNCVLTGKAATIQTLNKRLRQQGFSSRQLRTKAYWAPGKVGLE